VRGVEPDVERAKQTVPSSKALAVLALGVALLGGCAARYKLDAEAPTYAAQAKITVKVNKTNNRELTLKLDHLAPPARVEAGSGGGYEAYAVWISVPGHGLTRAGVLDYDAKRRSGRIVATTPHPKFVVLVSLERDRAAQQPSDTVILRKTVGRS
jgi:hypothetical protein